MNATRQTTVATSAEGSAATTQSFSLTTAKKHHGRTLYEFLSDVLPFFETADWSLSLVEGSVTVDGVPCVSNSTLIAKQQVSFTIKNYYEETVDINWQLIWQDDKFIVAYKPALLPVHRTTRNIVNTFTDLIRRDCSLPEAQVMHRLDLETAGLVLVAKNKGVAQQWQPQLKTLMTKKTYHAIVYGKPSWTEKKYTSQLVEKRDGAIRCQMHVEEQTDNGKSSTTAFRILKTNERYSVIECTLLTGRKHQIRAHLAHLDHPIVGDKIYAHYGYFYLKRLESGLNEHDIKQLKSPHHLLVAKSFQLQLEDSCIDLEVTGNHFPQAWQQFKKIERL